MAVATLSFEQARACILSKVSEARKQLHTERVKLAHAAGRILAEEIYADRAYPPLSRSVRDGFAVRASDLPGEFWIEGEVRAGELFDGEIEPGQALEIMTGAPMPRGADAVVMVEDTRVDGDRMFTERVLGPGANVNPFACEARRDEVLLKPGVRLGYAEIALLATVGCTEPSVFRCAEVAILATGDELVDVHELPLDHQYRNSNAEALAVQVRRAGACPTILRIARDSVDSTQELIEQGLGFNALVVSGGVSAGKYDIVESVLSSLGAEFFFDRVRIQPGQPMVFGRARDKFFFGLPGNPTSAMVTFEVLARAGIELLGGLTDPQLPLLQSRLTEDFQQKSGLTRFLPAKLSPDGASITPVSWHGSGDVPALMRANAFLITEPERESWKGGDSVRVLPR